MGDDAGRLRVRPLAMLRTPPPPTSSSSSSSSASTTTAHLDHALVQNKIISSLLERRLTQRAQDQPLNLCLKVRYHIYIRPTNSPTMNFISKADIL